MNDIQIVNAHTDGAKTLRGSFNPADPDIKVNGRGQFVRVNHAGEPAMVVNSLLTEDEWAEVESQVLAAARYPLRVVNDFRARGLVSRLGGVGSLEARWYTSSEITAATVNMTGRGRAERDLPEMLQSGVPVPVIFKEFAIDWRTLEASRRLGDGLDMTGLIEATRVVAEGYEGIVVGGNTAVTLNGRPIYGLRTHPNRNTAAVGGYGGGDWDTLSNITATIAGMINSANGQQNYGPFQVYISQAQYNQAALTYFTDGSGDTGLSRIAQMAMIAGVSSLPADTLPGGEILLLQMTPEYMELAEAIGMQVREWSTADGTESIFKVMVIGTPKIKARYGNQTGIVHATGA